MTALRDEGWDDVPPATGTFRTSWRGVYAEWLWPAVIGTAIGSALILFDGGDVDFLPIVFAVLGVVGAVFMAARYWLLGVRSVEITSDAVVVEPFGRSPVRLRRDELTDIWQGKKWYFETAERSVDVREYGFATDDWVDLSFTLRTWQDAGPVEMLPGVLARPAEDGKPEAAVYEPKHNSALWWGPVFFGAIAAITILVSLPSYREGAWMDDPIITVFCPLGSIAFLVLYAMLLPRLVRRATFVADAFVVERYVGQPKTIRYRDVLDFHVRHVVTRHGKFAIGDRNSGAFWRLLEPHLEERQLSGEMDAEFVVSLPYTMWGSLAGIALGFVVSIWAGYQYQLPGGVTSAIFLAVMVGCMGAAALFAKMAARRSKRELIDV